MVIPARLTHKPRSGGPRNILPAALIFSALGAAGQSAANLLDTQEQKEAKSLLARKWSPIKPFSDEDYKAMLEEKLLGIEADIALLDEKIAAIRAAAAAASESERKDGR